MDCEVVEGLYKCIDKLSENDKFVDHIHNELSIHKRAGGMFSFPATLKKRKMIAPARRERNWSTFEHIHSKKKSKLEHQKLQDLVYVKYNQAFHECHECRDLIDPIALKDIDDSNEWIVGELDRDSEDVKDELVFNDDTLTWRDVTSATKAVGPLKYTRRQTQMQRAVFASTSKKEKGKGVVEEEDEDESSQDEGKEEYNSSFNGSDEDNDMELEEDEDD
ncbi:hypothetical protein CR513_31885, partial [Mucuna pruriens]